MSRWIAPSTKPCPTTERADDEQVVSLEKLKRACVLAIVSTAACGYEGESSEFDAPERVTIPSEAVVSSFGVAWDSTGLETLHDAGVAAVSESGRFLAIADRSPPFVRIVDRITDSAWSFGPEGEGPGELARPAAVEILQDSMLLVQSRRRLERFTLSGRWLGGSRLIDANFFVFSTTVGCAGRIFAYGVPVGRAQDGDLPWLHELELGEEIDFTPRLTIRGPGWPGYTGMISLDGSAEGILLWHKFGDPESGYWLPCDGGEASMWSVGAGEATRPGSSGSVVNLPDTLFNGAAARNSVKVWAREALEPENGVEVTTFHVVPGEECFEIEILGSWNLLDAHEVGLVLSAREPFPRVQIIDWNWFEGSLTSARCRRGDSSSAR